MTAPRTTIGLIGGSGVADLLPAGPLHHVGTPWGAPSGPIQEATVGGLRVLFLPRHGVGHTVPPHRVNYRANIDALASLGAEAIVTVSSVGSLRAELPPGSFVLPSQFLDFTKQRPTTFYDGGKVYHVSMADPFCPDLLGRAEAAGLASGHPFATGRTYVCVEGPRFSTRAESNFYRGIADIIGMTLVPEVTLARERGLCYVCLGMVTDFDVWADKPVDAREVVETMHRNVQSMRSVIETLLPRLAAPPTCACPQALDAAGI
jgi:5'-methylthioadenosine phosphorylase